MSEVVLGSGLGLRIGDRPILRAVDVSLSAGEVTGVLGPNGSGKTSLLRLLSGEWEPTEGTVQMGGRPLRSIPVRHLGQRRAFLHQESALDFAFRVLEVVLLGRSPHMEGSERPEDYAVAREALRRVDLAEREGDLYTHLSGGEKQRVQLARVLAQIWGGGAGRVLYLDEPSNNLDLRHQRMVRQVVTEVAADGVAVGMVVHDLNHALQQADRLLVLREGRVVLSGEAGSLAEEADWEAHFGVPLRRVRVPGSDRPYLVATETGG